MFVGGDPETKISVRHLQYIRMGNKKQHNTWVLSPSSSLLTSRVDKLLPSSVCTLRWKHYCLLKIFYDKVSAASTVSLRSGWLWLDHKQSSQAWPMLISRAKMQNCTLILFWGEECQIWGNFSALRHLTCQGKLCNYYRQVSMLYIPVKTRQWETQQLKIFFSDLPTYF